jgi:hypothetical protein
MSENKRFEYKAGMKGNDVATYLYEDINGEVLFRKVKTLIGDPEHPKMFRFERLVDGKWVTGKGILDGVKKVPFRLPQLIKNSAVIVTEVLDVSEIRTGIDFS